MPPNVWRLWILGVLSEINRVQYDCQLSALSCHIIYLHRVSYNFSFFISHIEWIDLIFFLSAFYKSFYAENDQQAWIFAGHFVWRIRSLLSAIFKKMQLDVDVSPPANILSICLTLTQVTFDLNPSDLWPWTKWPLTLTHVTLTLIPSPVRLHGDLNSRFLTWCPWPLTLTFNIDLWVIPGHALTKFHGPRCNTFCNMNYCPVNFCPVTDGQAQSDAYEPTVH